MCDCIKIVNEKLATRNTRLTIPWVFTPAGRPPAPETVMIETEQVETGRGKAKAVGMFPTYCPFCGVKYEAEEVTEAA